MYLAINRSINVANWNPNSDRYQIETPIEKANKVPNRDINRIKTKGICPKNRDLN